MHFIDEEKKAVASVIIDPITKEVAIKVKFLSFYVINYLIIYKTFNKYFICHLESIYRN